MSADPADWRLGQELATSQGRIAWDVLGEGPPVDSYPARRAAQCCGAPLLRCWPSGTRTRTCPSECTGTCSPIASSFRAPGHFSPEDKPDEIAEAMLGFGLNRGSGQPGGAAEDICEVGVLPREVGVIAAEVTVGRGRAVDRPMQFQVVAECGRA